MPVLKSPSAHKNTGIEARCAATGMRMTEQRRVIARVLAEAEDHPDVEELYRRCVAVDDKISISTVYRTVKLFEDAGIIEQREEGGQFGHRAVVDDGDLIAGRDLDDLEPRVEGVLPHELRVHRQAVVAAEPLAEGDQPGFVLDVLRVW